MFRTTVVWLALGLITANQHASSVPPAQQIATDPILPGASKNFAPLVNKASQTWTERYVDVPVLGQTSAYVPKTPTSDVVLFLSGDDGWQLGVVDMARRIAARHIAVVGLNFVWMKRHQVDVACWDTAGELEEIAHAAEAQIGVKPYRPPTLVGYSSGATMVYSALAQGAAGSFAAGMSLGFCPDLPSIKPACPTGDWQPTFDEAKHTAWLPTTPDVKRDWYVLHGVQDTECTPADTEKFVSGIAHAHYVPIDGTGHGFGRPERWGLPFDEAIGKLFPSK
jgi:hypothetical protein